MRRPALGLAKFVAECAGGGGIKPLGGCGAAEDVNRPPLGGCGVAEDVNRPPFVLNVGADAAALSRAAAARKAVVCAAEPSSLAVRRGKWKFVWETGALDVRCGQPLNRSPNLGASGGAGCDEPGPAAVTGAVVAGAGAVTGAGAAGAGAGAVTGAAAVKGATAVTGAVAVAAAAAGTAAVTGEGCVVAMFAPRPLLTSSGQIRPLFGSNALRRRFAYAEPSEGLPALLARCGRP